MKVPAARRQCIALARVILKDALILAPDAAASGSGIRVGAAIRQMLTGMMEGKTVTPPAHPLSTKARTGRIVSLDQCLVVWSGAHAAARGQSGSGGRRRSAGFGPDLLPAAEVSR